MKVELHLHTNRYSLCAANTPAELMAHLVTAGYGAVYITEHHQVWPDEQLDALRGEFPAIRIFPGMELGIGDEPVQHLLVLGTNDPAYLTLDAEAVLTRARRLGHLTVLAHPVRWPGGADMLFEGLLPDAIELDTPNQPPPMGDGSRALAEKFGLPLVNAGDVHAFEMTDRFWIETHRPLSGPRDLREMIRTGAYDNCSR